jgi:hypothetical protein
MMSQPILPLPPQTLGPVERRQRLLYLGFVCFPLGVLGLANVWGMKITLWGCPLLQWIGVPCMGWGMTRSVLATLRGDLSAAAGFHLFGPLLVVGGIVTLLHWTVELWRGRHLHLFYNPWLQGQRVWILGFLGVLGYHLTRIVALSQSGQLQRWMASSHLGHWL